MDGLELGWLEGTTDGLKFGWLEGTTLGRAEGDELGETLGLLVIFGVLGRTGQQQLSICFLHL